MRIVSWNVNGLAANIRRGTFLKAVKRLSPDILCCQEIKSRASFKLDGYYKYWNLAKCGGYSKHSHKGGYSGTLILTRIKPLSVYNGFGIKEYDAEGRAITLEFDSFYVVNVYVPNSQDGPERLNYRVEWDIALQLYLQQLKKPVIICGDFNVARSFIDVYPENLRNEETLSGFTPIERENMESLLNSGFVDVFRHFYPDRTGCYTWWSTRQESHRPMNRGWRLDYFIISQELIGLVQGIEHNANVYGSDHCPVSLDIKTPDNSSVTDDEKAGQLWRSIDWDAATDYVFMIQRQLALAAYRQDWARVKDLQKELVRSFSAKALAVRHVVEVDSQPGIDGVKWRTDAEKYNAARSLTSKDYKAMPYKRIIFKDPKKPNKTRPLNIPVAYDKAMHTLYSYALDPVAESIADRKSFGFRKGRSPFDAHAYIMRAFSGPDAPQWALSADVAECYDALAHGWLLRNIPMDKKVLYEFLTADTFFEGRLQSTERGISQGATLSTILGNLALDGLQAYLQDKLYPDGDIDYRDCDLVRFADDFIIATRSESSANAILSLVDDFLEERGLRVNEAKTKIVNMREGFEFLSRWYSINSDGKIECVPSGRAIRGFERRLSDVILNFDGSQATLIKKINQMLNGFGNYHRIENATDAFRHIDSVVDGLLVKKLRMLHPSRQWGHIRRKYWRKDENGNYVFALEGNPSVHVVRLAYLNLVQHTPVKTNFHPYLDKEYYLMLQHRRDDQKINSDVKRGVWNRQEGLCYYCGKEMRRDQHISLVEINLGEGRRSENLAYVHTRCRDSAYNVLSKEVTEGVDLPSLLDGVTEPEPAKSPYAALSEYFRLAHKSPFTLTFDEIEAIIGEELPWAALFFRSFWYDLMPGLPDSLVADDYDLAHSIIIPENGFPIAKSWTEQGYEIQSLYLDKRRVVFRRTVENVSGLVIPEQLLKKKIPDKAIFEINEFCKMIIKKYGL